MDKVVYVSATPAQYELEKSEGLIIEQIIRPTGLIDPVIQVRPVKNQIDDLLKEIKIRIIFLTKEAKQNFLSEGSQWLD